MPNVCNEQFHQHPVTFVFLEPPCKNLSIEKSWLSELWNKKNLTSARHAKLQLSQGQTSLVGSLRYRKCSSSAAGVSVN
jgi:hypothetical protein